MNKNKRWYLIAVFLLVFGSASLLPRHRYEAVASPYNLTTNHRGIQVLQVAVSELGHGELGGNNKGKYVQRYTGSQGLPWCAGFISYCAKRAGLELRYTLRAKDFVNLGTILCQKEVASGDIVVFNRKGGGHVGIIEQTSKDGFVSIEGNVGNYPAKVKRIKHKWTENSIYRYVRL